MGGEAAVRLTLKYSVGHGVFGAALATDPGVFSWASLQSRGTAAYEVSGFSAAAEKNDDAAACKFEQRYYLSNVFAKDPSLFEQFGYAQYLRHDDDSLLSHIDVRIRFVAGKDDKRHAEAVSQLGYVEWRRLTVLETKVLLVCVKSLNFDRCCCRDNVGGIL